MKSVLGWLGDPYIHMFAVALILARLAMGVGPDDAKAEKWEFVPGTVVVGQHRKMSDGTALVACQRAPTTDRDASTDVAEAVAGAIEIKLDRRAGLRLVSLRDTAAFLRECERMGVGIWGRQRFRLVDGDLTLVDEPDDFSTRSREISRSESHADARAFVARAPGEDLLFDFTLEEPGRWDAPWNTRPHHYPPVPIRNPRIHPLEDADVRNLRQELEPRGFESYVHLFEIENGAPPDGTRILRDAAVLAFGEALPDWPRIVAPAQLWHSIPSRPEALKFLGHVASEDLAYGGPRIPTAVAARIADKFVGRFTSGALFFANGTIGRDGLFDCWIPLTTATMEAGFGAVDATRAGLFVVTGED